MILFLEGKGREPIRSGQGALMISLTQSLCAVAAFVGLCLSLPAAAAEPESCPGLIASRDARVSWAALRQEEVGLRFVGHATFLIETPQGCGLPLTTVTAAALPSPLTSRP